MPESIPIDAMHPVIQADGPSFSRIDENGLQDGDSN